MPLPRDTHRALEEITSRARRIYRNALKMQTTHRLLADDALAEMYVDSRVVATYADLVWRQSGDAAREEYYAQRTEQPEPETPELQAEHD